MGPDEFGIKQVEVVLAGFGEQVVIAEAGPQATAIEMLELYSAQRILFDLGIRKNAPNDCSLLCCRALPLCKGLASRLRKRLHDSFGR